MEARGWGTHQAGRPIGEAQATTPQQSGMNDFDDYLRFVGLVVLGAMIGVPLLYGRARSERWGGLTTKEQVGGAPFRGGEVTRRTPRGAPGWVKLVAGGNAAWALLTLLLFTPSWLTLAGLAADTARTSFAVITPSLVAIDGLIWSFVMTLATRSRSAVSVRFPEGLQSAAPRPDVKLTRTRADMTLPTPRGLRHARRGARSASERMSGKKP